MVNRSGATTPLTSSRQISSPTVDRNCKQASKIKTPLAQLSAPPHLVSSTSHRRHKELVGIQQSDSILIMIIKRQAA